MSRPFTPAWSAHVAYATRLLPNPLGDRDQLAAMARRVRDDRVALGRHTISPDVWEVLAAQEALRPDSPARRRNLERLQGGALVVATGQQVGLFMGPLYALHKAATAIVWARELERILEHPVVPLFWLQTEDADFDEVKTAWLPGPEGLVALSLEPGPTTDHRPLDGNARVSLGQRRIGLSIAEVLATAKTLLTGPHADETLALLERVYRPDRTLGEAAGDLMATLFGDEGLLIFDPRPAQGPAPASTTQFQATLGFALSEHNRIEAALRDRARELDDLGFDVQVKVRERTALLCLHPDGPTGDRFRLTRGPEGWSLAGHPMRLTHDDAMALVSEPHRYSTTALLRPLLQDSLLPTVAYVGGPGEIAYWAQIPPLYDLAGLPMPLVLPRARLHLSTPTSRRLTAQLGLAEDAWRHDAEQLRAQTVGARADIVAAEGLVNTWRDMTSATLTALSQAAGALGDPTFERQADKSKDQLEQTMTRTLERLKRLALERDQETRHRLERLLALTRPHGGPQERALSFPTFAALVSPGELCRRIVAAVEPLVAGRRLAETVEVPL